MKSTVIPSYSKNFLYKPTFFQFVAVCFVNFDLFVLYFLYSLHSLYCKKYKLSKFYKNCNENKSKYCYVGPLYFLQVLETGLWMFNYINHRIWLPKKQRMVLYWADNSRWYLFLCEFLNKKCLKLSQITYFLTNQEVNTSCKSSAVE